MCITEDKLVESYETGLFNRILFEVEYNRRKKNDEDLDVRIQTSHRSDPTAAKAIEHIIIRDAIKECNFSRNILKEIDDSEKHKRDILKFQRGRSFFSSLLMMEQVQIEQFYQVSVTSMNQRI